MARKNVMYVISWMQGKPAQIGPWRQPFFQLHKFCQLQLFFKVQVHSTRLEIELTLEKEHHMCECDVFMSTEFSCVVLQ